ncbi:MAG: hypothetical protein JWM33_3077 [Caulobacteraceae bacterium]|nr:hypothetical protein [Caulobacteraceae bacterium]
MKLASTFVVGLALALASSASLWAAQPPAVQQPAAAARSAVPGGARKLMTRAEIEQFAKSGGVLCQDWRSGVETCRGVAFLDLLPDGSVQETIWFRLSESPKVEIGLRDTVSFDGDALCSVNDSNRTQSSVMIDGKPATPLISAVFSQPVRNQLRSEDGNLNCETFYHDASGAGVLSSATTNGARAPALDSSYRLFDKGVKLGLRMDDGGRLTA